MTPKRKTQAQREAQQKAALRQRIGDIMTGATGQDPEDECAFITLGDYHRIVRSIQIRFEPQVENLKYITAIHNAYKYETMYELTDFLFGLGIRA